MALPDAVHEVISHFLTEFSPDQRVCKTEDYIFCFLARRYAKELVEDLTNKYFKTICNILIEEYDDRIASRELLRYKFIDEAGQKVSGMGQSWQKQIRIFQDALNELTDADFESLSARVLALLGCNEVWLTPLSHDQGLDAFGYAQAHPHQVPREISCQCRIVYLAQAKHYKKHKVGSRDIREFVGSRDLAMFKIFSNEDQMYKNLVIKPFGPSVMVFVTTEELPRTVKIMGKNAGIVVLSAQDLAVLFIRSRIVSTKRWGRRNILAALRRSLKGLPKAE